MAKDIIKNTANKGFNRLRRLMEGSGHQLVLHDPPGTVKESSDRERAHRKEIAAARVEAATAIAADAERRNGEGVSFEAHERRLAAQRQSGNLSLVPDGSPTMDDVEMGVQLTEYTQVKHVRIWNSTPEGAGCIVEVALREGRTVRIHTSDILLSEMEVDGQ